MRWSEVQVLVTLPALEVFDLGGGFLELTAQHAHLVLQFLHLQHQVGGYRRIGVLRGCRIGKADGQREAGHQDFMLDAGNHA
jgi:hypothetical protein